MFNMVSGTTTVHMTIVLLWGFSTDNIAQDPNLDITPNIQDPYWDITPNFQDPYLDITPNFILLFQVRLKSKHTITTGHHVDFPNMKMQSNLLNWPVEIKHLSFKSPPWTPALAV